MSDNPVRVRIFVEARPSESTDEIDRADWKAMSPQARADRLDEMTQQALSDAGGAGYELLDPADEKDLP